MSSSEYAEIQDTISRVFFDQKGGRASADEVFRDLIDDLPEHLTNHVLAAGLKNQIGRFFRTQRTDGLPQAPEADADGTHVQLELLEVDEFRYVIGRQLKASASARTQAEKLAALCETVHGVTIALVQTDEVA